LPEESFGEVGGLAQLARALDLHSRGHRFDSDILHEKRETGKGNRNVSDKEVV
jgi:hypothetical protein